MLLKYEVREDLKGRMKRGDRLSSMMEIKDTNKKGEIQMELLLFVTDKDLEKYSQHLARMTKV